MDQADLELNPPKDRYNYYLFVILFLIKIVYEKLTYNVYYIQFYINRIKKRWGIVYNIIIRVKYFYQFYIYPFTYSIANLNKIVLD